MYRTVTFKHECPGEWHTSAEGGEEVAPESRQLPEEVARFVEPSVSFIGPVVQHSYYGWAFEVKVGECIFFTVFNIIPDECYLTVSLSWYFLKRLLRKRPMEAFESYCGILEDALRAIPSVSDISWQEYRN